MSNSMSLYQIRIEGWRALTERLGPAGAMRFMMQYDPGHGDYTEERRAMFADLSIDDIFDAINERERSPKASVENAAIAGALESTKGNRVKAPRRLKIGQRASQGKLERRKPAK